MKIKAPKPFSESGLFRRAAQSKDQIIQRRAGQYVIDQLADQIESNQDLERVLVAIPDPEQRYIILDALKPLLKFEPKTIEEV